MTSIEAPSAARKPPRTDLTKRAIERATPAGSPFILWDAAVRGFGLHVAPSGLKTFVFQYRTKLDLRSRRFTIGRFGAWTVEAARKEARSLTVRVDSGEDPVSGRRDARAAETMNDLFDLYLKEHARPKNKPRTFAEVERLLARKVRPEVGKLKVGRIAQRDVAKLHQSMRETPRQANFAMAIVSKALTLAEEWGMRPVNTNPCGLITRYPENHRTRFLKGSEVQRVGAAIEAAEGNGLPWRVRPPTSKRKAPAPSEVQRTRIAWQAVGVIRLLLMTGARLSEILELRPEHIDWQEGTIALPTKKGDKREAHPVSGHVMALLKGFPQVEGSPWIFPRADDPKRHVTKEVVENAWQRIRIAAAIEDVRLHDLRHTVGTYASQAGVSAFIVRDLLRHRNVTTTNRYSNFDADPVRHASDAVADRIAAALAGGTGAQVVPLSRPSQFSEVAGREIA